MPNIDPKKSLNALPENAAQEIFNYLSDDVKRQFLIDFNAQVAEVSIGIKACVKLIQDQPHFSNEADFLTPKNPLSTTDAPDCAALQKLAITAIQLFSENTLQKIKAMNHDRSGFAKVKIVNLQDAAAKAAKPGPNNPF